jgi:predicted O-methyltransferase YrrM
VVTIRPTVAARQSRARKSRFGPPISIEEEMRTGAISYWQGEYYQSRADKNGVSLLDYIHAIFGLLRQTQAQSVAMIGCAGGSLATMLSRVGCDVVAVDVNPQAFVLARRYFGLPAQIECRVADGFDYLLATRRKFDAVVVDAFRGGRIASELMSPVFFGAAAKRLRRGGVIIANVHVAKDSDAMAERMAGGMSAALPDVRILDRRGAKHRNAIVAAGAVKGLKRPGLVMAPHIEAAKLATALAAMQFRTYNAPS